MKTNITLNIKWILLIILKNYDQIKKNLDKLISFKNDIHFINLIKKVYFFINLQNNY